MYKILLTIAVLLLPGVAAAQSPLEQFRGHFRGTATGTFTSGARESFTCTATNGGSGSQLTINIRCANAAGARFEIRSALQAQGGALSGTWRIVDPSYDGSISGNIEGSRIRVSIAGGAFKGTATVERSAGSLSANISIADGVRLVASLR